MLILILIVVAFVCNMFAVIEREDGTTYTQEFEDLYGLINLIDSLGDGYEIVDIF